MRLSPGAGLNKETVATARFVWPHHQWRVQRFASLEVDHLAPERRIRHVPEANATRLLLSALLLTIVALPLRGQQCELLVDNLLGEARAPVLPRSCLAGGEGRLHHGCVVLAVVPRKDDQLELVLLPTSYAMLTQCATARRHSLSRLIPRRQLPFKLCYPSQRFVSLCISYGEMNIHNHHMHYGTGTINACHK